MDVEIDRDSSVSARQQIRATIVAQIASGALRTGEPLPSVRDLADRSGLAPMTVTRVYADLKQGGLIEARAGSGTFVAESALTRLGAGGAAAGIWQAIDDLVADATRRGISVGDLLSLVASRDRAATATVNVVMVGLFIAATRSYAARVTAQTGVAVAAVALLDEEPSDADLTARLAGADLILTFDNLHPRLAALAPQARIVSLRFIPAEATRLALAGLDPLAKVVAVSRFEDFLPVLTAGMRRFAAHVPTVSARVMGDADLSDLLAGADVVVMSTGAERAADQAPAGATLIEYRHVPDPGDIDRQVAPLLGLLPPSARKEAS
ncbi:GntR family transcriptional regulator [Loktanella sp. M215]|uniref:GntR family transcriptional regulator n=1 Tax=Loktanella sp. M215 TaxID=2675431 RepID=UPI001F007C92|nr:GntR family transcriptional regulator [Loktanella sp. M215]MCF7700740.1 GntR family transcriptional regulator [Loktanella sp. M215]